MMQMNNPIMQFVSVMKNGGNPVALMQKMAGNNPLMAQAMQLINGKSPQQLQQMAQNMARECGINLEDFVRSLGITVPSNR